MTRFAVLLAALAAGFAIFYADAVTPPPLGISAPASRFSAGRAMEDVKAIAQKPHPVASPENQAVRDRLIQRLRGMNLDVRVQAGEAFTARGSRVSGAHVENLVAVLKGSDPSAAPLALMAHYDSVPGSPGAADDAAGVATALEITRMIQAKGTPRRDVVVLLTDGEEAGLLGARAFWRDDPLAARLGYVMNFETRGAGGKAMMFQTAARNGQDIALYRRTADPPLSNALTIFVYRNMPNDTDFTVTLKHGGVGLNYAFLGRQFDYHSASATPEALDQGSLQQMGSQAAPTALELAFGDLPARAPDTAYLTLPGGLLTSLAGWQGWLLVLVSAGLVGLTLARAKAQRADIIRGGLTGLFGLVFAALLLETARRLTGVPNGYTEYRPILAQFPLFEVMMATAALSALACAVRWSAAARWTAPAVLSILLALGATVLYGDLLVEAVLGVSGAVLSFFAFRRKIEPTSAWGGALLLGVILSAAAQALAPTAALTLLLPLTAAAILFAVTRGGRWGGALALGVAGVIAALVVAVQLTLFHALLQGLDLPPLAAFGAWLALPALWPLLAPGERRTLAGWVLPAAPALLAAVLALVVRFDTPWTERHPDSVEPIYIADPTLGRALRANLLTPNAWAKAWLKENGATPTEQVLSVLDRPFRASPEPLANLPAPAVAMTALPDGGRQVALAPHPGAHMVRLALKSAAGVSGLTINGAPVDAKAKAGKWLLIQWRGDQGVSVSVPARAARGLEADGAEVFDAWLSPRPLPDRPRTIQFWDLGGSTWVLARSASAE